MIERTSGTQPRCLSYGGTVIIQQPHGSLLPIPSKQERERERDPGWVWSPVSRTKFMLREDAAILCGIQAQEGLAVCRPKAVPSFLNPNY